MIRHQKTYPEAPVYIYRRIPHSIIIMGILAALGAVYCLIIVPHYTPKTILLLCMCLLALGIIGQRIAWAVEMGKVPIIELGPRGVSYCTFDRKIIGFTIKTVAWSSIYSISIENRRRRPLRLVIKSHLDNSIFIDCDGIELQPSKLRDVFRRYHPLKKEWQPTSWLYHDFLHSWLYPLFLLVGLFLIFGASRAGNKSSQGQWPKATKAHRLSP